MNLAYTKLKSISAKTKQPNTWTGREGGPNMTFQERYRFVHPRWRAGYGEELLRSDCEGPVLSFSRHLAASLSGRRNSPGIARTGSARKPYNLRDSIFAVTQMLEIVDLLYSYKTNNLHIFRTETFFTSIQGCPWPQDRPARKSLKILTPRVPSIDFPN